jgi:anti-anti-sigma factor
VILEPSVLMGKPLIRPRSLLPTVAEVNTGLSGVIPQPAKTVGYLRNICGILVQVRAFLMALGIQTQISGDVFIVRCDGRIVFGDEGAALRERIGHMLSGSPRIVVNLNEVHYVDSGGLGILVGLAVSARTRGCRKTAKFLDSQILCPILCLPLNPTECDGVYGQRLKASSARPCVALHHISSNVVASR